MDLFTVEDLINRLEGLTVNPKVGLWYKGIWVDDSKKLQSLIKYELNPSPHKKDIRSYFEKLK